MATNSIIEDFISVNFYASQYCVNVVSPCNFMIIRSSELYDKPKEETFNLEDVEF